MNIEVPSNPAALAAPIVETRFTDTTFEGSASDEADLVRLDRLAEEANFLEKKWIVSATRAFITPLSFEKGEEVTVHVLDSLYCDGKFVCYSRVSIGRIERMEGIVRALCMTFSRGILVTPRFVDLDERELLHVPVLAVSEMQQSPKML